MIKEFIVKVQKGEAWHKLTTYNVDSMIVGNMKRETAVERARDAAERGASNWSENYYKNGETIKVFPVEFSK